MQDAKKTGLSGRGMVRKYLRAEIPGIAVASLCAVLLGFVGAVLTALLGPGFQIVSGPRAQFLSFDSLFGAKLGPLANQFFGVDGMVASELLARLPLWILTLAVAKTTFSLTQWYLWERAGERVSMRLRADLVKSFLAVDPARRKDTHARTREADLSSSVTNDVRMLREYLVHFYGGLPREALQCLFTAATLFFLSQKLTLIFLFGLLPAGAVLSRIGKKLRKRAGRALADYSGLVEWLQQRLLGVETIKHYRTEALEAQKMAELTDNLFARFLRAARVKARTSPMLEALGVVSLAVVLLISFSDVAAGRTTGAVQLSFFAALAVLSQSAAKLGRYLNSNREGAAAVERLTGMFDFLAGAAKEPPHHTDKHNAAQASLSFDGVCVRYPGTTVEALSDFSYRFDGGRIYCLVGPSGAGKTTVFGVGLGLVEPSAGRLKLSMPGPLDKQKIIYMPQKVQLAPASVAQNVAYPDAIADHSRVEAALARVGLSALVAALPQGLDTSVGEGGHGVSGGQAQRILLARLCYHDAPIAFVDEGTSALDPEVERLVYALLKDMAARGAAVVTIAHRPSAAAIADEILLMQAGRLVASGPAREITSSALYQKLLQ